MKLTKKNILLWYKIRKIEKRIKKIISEFSKEKFGVFHLGAYTIDPKCLVFIVHVESDVEKERLINSTNFMSEVKETLDIYDYPIQSRDNIVFEVESHETVNRESGGDWYLHFK